jgi:hypothetical protein
VEQFMPVRLEWYTERGVTPYNDGEEEFLVETAHVDSLRARRLDAKYHDAVLLGDVLSQPTSIFRGLRRPGYQEGYCYCGKPPRRFDANGVIASPPGKVFAAYVILLPAKQSFVVFDWDWLSEHDKKPGFPQNYQTAFVVRTWPT